jgi:D-alanine-D-alanine ligase
MSLLNGKVGVLYGGTSQEREISLLSGQAVYEALLAKGVNAHLFDTGKHSLGDLEAQRFDRVFLALHGRYGEDGSVQGALELLGIPYTGSGHLAAAIAMDKVVTKRLWQQAGLPTPDYRVLSSEIDLDGLVEQLGLPMIIKAPNEGSTIGLYKVTHANELQAAYAQARTYDDIVLAEKFVVGRELTVALLGSGPEAKALPAVEILAPGGNYSYENKYFSDDTQYECPAQLPESVSRSLSEIALQAYRSLGAEGWARVDFMLDQQMQPWLLELNATPGMTSHSLVPMAARALGLDFEQLCLDILSGARCKVVRSKNNLQLKR